MTTMGPYLSGLAPGDVDSSEKVRLQWKSKTDEEPMKPIVPNNKIFIFISVGFDTFRFLL